jgi:hypothetical protein
MFNFQPSFDRGLPYDQFLAAHGNPADRHRWGQVLEQISLAEAHRQLLARFTRRMNLLCMAGAWCGDCAAQCPILYRFAENCRLIELRFVDRDNDAALADELTLCGSPRVPQVIFLDEDGNHVGRFGDRTLSRYRKQVEELSGAACSTGLVRPGAALDLVVQEWLDQVERVQWLLRTSPRLRDRHGD